MFRYSLLAVITVALIGGCLPSALEKKMQADAAKKQAARAESDAKRKRGGIFKKTTQDIGKFDPNAGHTVADSKIRATIPGLSALQAYGPLMQKVSNIGVDHAVALFHATNGRWPTYEEFMSQIIKNKQGQMRLPVLPGKKKYYYDEANHTLVVVDPNPPKAEEKKE